MSFGKNFLVSLFSLALTLTIVFGIFLFYLIITLPNVSQLKDIHLQVPLRIYTADNKLIAEFGDKRRIPITIDQVPKTLIKAIIDTEDQRFYEHQGVDLIGLMRASKNLFITGKKSEGASTITMQVARDFYLSPEKTYTRKFKEMIIAFKIDRAFDKNTILELYLNKVYFGQHAYGVAAAAQVYFGKELNQLDLSEMATIAGLPQAPSRNNPLSNPKAALERRNHVLKRMLDNHDINEAAYHQAINTPISTYYHDTITGAQAPFAAEMARAEVYDKYGDSVYDGGLKVYTTIDSRLQGLANYHLRKGVIAFTKRHNAVEPEKRLGKYSEENEDSWQENLDDLPIYNGLYPAAITNIADDKLTLLLANGEKITINDPDQADRLDIGFVIRVQHSNNGWEIVPLPKANGAMVAINPHNGAILALIGGFSYAQSNFNCATQADRQPGSSLKPFIYSAALEKGFTLASIINDAPLVIQDYSGLWRPQNFTHDFLGPTRIRVALTESRNLVSIRLLQAIGIPYAISYLQRFGFAEKDLPHSLSLALGTANTSPLELASAYAVFANGGYQVQPYLITKIVSQDSKVLFEANIKNAEQTPAVITPQNAYLMNDVMKDVVKHAAATYSLHLTRHDLAGKTGTTNQQQDTWFAGFNTNLVTTVWLGFNIPQSLHEYGAQAALPIWLDFMQEALQNEPESILPQPPGIVSVRIDPTTGLLAYPNQKNAIFEYFYESGAPSEQAPASAPVVAAPADNSNTTEPENQNPPSTTSAPESNTDNGVELF